MKIDMRLAAYRDGAVALDIPISLVERAVLVIARPGQVPAALHIAPVSVRIASNKNASNAGMAHGCPVDL